MLKVQTLNFDDEGPGLSSTSPARIIKMERNRHLFEMKYDRGLGTKNDNGIVLRWANWAVAVVCKTDDAAEAWHEPVDR